MLFSKHTKNVIYQYLRFMERRTFINILLTVGFLALIPIAYGIYLYIKNQYIDWSEGYQIESKEPYNSYMIFNLLKNSKTDDKFEVIDNLLTEKFAEDDVKQNEKPISYIFIGRNPFLLDEEVDSMMNFVKRGNTAFIISSDIPDTLYSLLLGVEYEGYHYTYDSLIATNFTNPSIQNEEDFTFNYREKNESKAAYWRYFNEGVIEYSEKNVEKLGFFQGKSNMKRPYHYEDEEEEEIENQKIHTNLIRIKHGKGYFYLHRNPVLFTNYYLIQKSGKEYVERALSYLPEGDMLWDERSHFYKQGKETKREYQKEAKRESPLSYILSQESFAWAYYTLIISAVLFIIFRGKRMQRIIPILRKEQNTSLEFTKTVGQLYYLQQDHKRLAQLKIRLFFDFVRTKYHMNTQHIDEDFKKKLSERSDISRENINTLLTDIQKINGQHEVSEWLLRKIHTQIQDFYTNCK